MARIGANFSGMTSPVAFFAPRSEHRCVATSNVILWTSLCTRHPLFTLSQTKTYLSFYGWTPSTASDAQLNIGIYDLLL